MSHHEQLSIYDRKSSWAKGLIGLRRELSIVDERRRNYFFAGLDVSVIGFNLHSHVAARGRQLTALQLRFGKYCVWFLVVYLEVAQDVQIHLRFALKTS